jgi:hypothetical protein
MLGWNKDTMKWWECSYSNSRSGYVTHPLCVKSASVSLCWTAAIVNQPGWMHLRSVCEMYFRIARLLSALWPCWVHWTITATDLCPVTGNTTWPTVSFGNSAAVINSRLRCASEELRNRLNDGTICCRTQRIKFEEDYTWFTPLKFHRTINSKETRCFVVRL